MTWVWHNKRQPEVEPEWNTPVLPLSDAYRQYLALWDERCRGYAVSTYPVHLEPPYTPLTIDGVPQPDALEAAFPLAASTGTGRSFVVARLPIEQKVAPAAAESLLLAISRSTSIGSFEMVADSEEITYQWSHEAGERDNPASSLQMHCPLADVAMTEDIMKESLQEFADIPVGYRVIDFGLYQPIYQPLKHIANFAIDPQAGIIAVLGQVQAGEVAGLQVLFCATTNPWSESIPELAAQFTKPGSRYEQSLERRARAKVSSPLVASVIRVFAVSRDGDNRAFALCQKLGGALGLLTETGGNQLIALDNAGYADEDHFTDLLNRTSHRQGMILSSAELSGLVHPPHEKLQHPKLVRLDPQDRPIPEELGDSRGPVIGTHVYRQKRQTVAWPETYRTRHAYILGATRMGKSTLLMNLIKQDMEQGRGLCLIDPHGDLAQDVLSLVPSDRAEDALYLDLSDRDFPVAMGLLEAKDEWEKRLLVSDLLAILHRLFASSWGDRLEHILRQVLMTLLAKPGHTLRDVRPLLTDAKYREQVLKGIRDPDLVTFWQGEFRGYTPATLAPIYNKLGTLLSSPLVRNIVAQPESRLPIARLMTEQKIIIVNLAQSLIGGDNAHLLGALLVSKIQIAAMQSLREQRGSRKPFTLVVDEFQNFVVSSFEKILSEAGKVELSLVMANQFLEQLPNQLQTAILSNVGTLISFRVSSDSARHLEPEFGRYYPAAQILDLQRGEAIVRLGQASDSFRINTLPPPQKPKVTHTQAIVERTRSTYCRTRTEVEAQLFDSDPETSEHSESDNSNAEGSLSDEFDGQGDSDEPVVTRRTRRSGTVHNPKATGGKGRGVDRSQADHTAASAGTSAETADSTTWSEPTIVGPNRTGALDESSPEQQIGDSDRPNSTGSTPIFQDATAEQTLEPECFGLLETEASEDGAKSQASGSDKNSSDLSENSSD